MKSKTFYNEKNQAIGIYKDNIFRKRVKKSKHFMKIFNAWGIEEKVVNDLEKEQCEEIRILDTENNIIYSVSFDAFKDKGFVKDFTSLQRFLPLKYWEINERI